MKRFTSVSRVIFAMCLLFLLGTARNAHASGFREIPFEFEDYNDTILDWVDSDDDANSDSTALGFSVTIGGATYNYFSMSSDGYIELLTDACDVPTDYGFGCIDELIYDDPNSTYLLAGYDDLSSYCYGYYGYKLFSDRAVFYYDTETYWDECYELLNNFK